MIIMALIFHTCMLSRVKIIYLFDFKDDYDDNSEDDENESDEDVHEELDLPDDFKILAMK